MDTISRRLSNSNIRRKEALENAAQKQASPGPLGSALTPNTVTRLAAVQPLYTGLYNTAGQKKALAIQATASKNAALNTLRLECKSFIGVFNFGVERGKYQAAERAYFGIDADNSNLPNLSTENDVKQLAKQITDNDAARVAAGGAAMANPSTAEVLAALNAYTPLAQAASNAYDAYDTALEELTNASVEVDKLIKKIWDEVETFFNEEEPESMRQNARQWGVQYVTIGEKATVTLTITDSQTPAQPVVGATVKQSDTGTERVTNAQGVVVFETQVFGEDVKFEISADGFLEKVISLNYAEGATVNQTVVLT